MQKWIAGLVLAAGIGMAGGAHAQDAAAGEKVFKGRCGACHQTTDAKSGPAAPSLKGVYGRPIASLADFNYSPALKAKKGRWTATELGSLLSSPMKYAPGTKMFMTVTDPTDRANVIAYLKTAK